MERVESDLAANIAEVDELGGTFAKVARPMFGHATEVLHLSEREAYERITRLGPRGDSQCLWRLLKTGRLHLSGIGQLAPHLIAKTCQTLLARAVTSRNAGSHRRVVARDEGEKDDRPGR